MTGKAVAADAVAAITDRRAVIAVDVGGSSIKAGVLGPAGCLELRRVPTGRERGPDAVIATIAATLAALDDWCRDSSLDVAGACVAVPGIVDDSAGVGRLSVTLGWRDRPIRDEVDPQRGYPVVLTHDVRAGGLAEATFGAASGAGAAIFVPIGTGLAAAIVIDGTVRIGAARQAGEVGQLLVVAPPTGADPAAGARVTLEDVSSARAIAARYCRAAGLDLDASEVLARSDNGDPIARSVVAEAMRSLGTVLAAAVTTIDPDVVVIGGGLTRASTALVDGLGQALADELPWRPAPRVVSARFSADAGFVGTALVAWQRAVGGDVADLAGALAGEWTGAAMAAPR